MYVMQIASHDYMEETAAMERATNRGECLRDNPGKVTMCRSVWPKWQGTRSPFDREMSLAHATHQWYSYSEHGPYKLLICQMLSDKIHPALASPSSEPRQLRTIRLPTVGLLTLALQFIAAHPSSAESTSLRSDAKHFTVHVSGIEHPEHVNHMHGLELSLTTADGRPASGAVIVLTGRRRYSSTPLPTLPKVSSGSGPGHYGIAGLRFHMPGVWRLVLDIGFAHIRDRATLDVVVK